MSEAKDLEPLDELEAAIEAAADETRGDEEVEVEILAIGDEEIGDASPRAAIEVEPEELGELRERHLRLRADFENYRKRAERERAERVRRGIGEVLRELLPVADNLERAASAPGGLEDLRLGVGMIARQLDEVLRRQGVEPIAAMGAPFDPQLHEAVTREEGAEVEMPTVVGELQRGYLHGPTLLRPALVRVAMPAGEAPPAAADREAGDEEAEP